MTENGGGTALVERQDMFSPGAKLVSQSMSRETYDLVRATVARDANPAEAAMFLELAAHYRLDPFAKEIWCFKGSGGIIIMVGRDGLRRIAKRNKLWMDGDVVRAKDTFRIERGADRQRKVVHTYEGGTETRGPIVGAWAEVWDEEGVQRGYFYAPLHEWRPTSQKKLEHSPWGSAESVMILACAERQALRQATPLGGLVVEGEMDRAEERHGDDPASPSGAVALEAVIDGLEAPEDVRDRLYDAIQEANRLSPNAWPSVKAQVAFAGRSAAQLQADAEQIERENAEMAARKARSVKKEDAEATAADPEVREAEVVSDEERWVELTEQVVRLRERLEEMAEDAPEREKVAAQLKEAEEELGALPHPDDER